MKKTSKKILAAIILVAMLSQTLYSAAASVFGLSTRSYAYADDEMTEDIEPGEAVDESTQDDAEVIQEAPLEYTDEGGSQEENDAYINEPDEEADPYDEGMEEEEEAVPDIRLRASYADSETGSEIKDTEDLHIDTDYMYIFKYDASEITGYSYNETTINIEEENYNITAILTGNKNGTEVYSITTDRNAADKEIEEISWTELVKDAVIVMHYDAIEEPEEELEDDTEEVENNTEEHEDSTERMTKTRYTYSGNGVTVTATLGGILKASWSGRAGSL